MLLPRTRLSLTFTQNTLRRCARPYSTPSVSYSSKVRALPFVATSEDVVRRAGPLAALQMFQKDYFSNIVGAVRAYYGFNGQPPWPARMQAVYLPTWIIDARASAKFWLSKRGDENIKQTTLHVYFQRSFMPGFSMDPLSQMSFSELATDEHLKTALPFGEELRKQNDADVLCLPYTATPFALTEAARTLSFSDAMVEEDFRFDPATLRSHLITAYPLLIPVYLLQYDADPGADKKPYSVTMVVEASQPQGTVITENVLPLTSRLFRESVSKNSLFDIPEELAGEEFMRVLPWNSPMRESFARATCFSNAKPKDSWKAQLGEWVDDRARAAGAMARYAQLQVSLGQAVDFDDIRVRDVGEAPAFTEYLSKEQNVLFYRHTMERLQHINARTKNAEVEVEVFELSKDGTSKTQNGSSALESVLQSMKEQLSQSEAVMNKHKPEWLKEWEARQKEEAEKEDSDRS